MNRRAFSLVEAAVLAVVVGCIAALVLVLGHDQRRQGRLGEDIAKLRAIGALTIQYAADNSDVFSTFSWRKGQSLSHYPDLNSAPTDTQAGSNQAVDILRRVAGRSDIEPPEYWLPYISYSKLVLADAGLCSPLDSLFISSQDRNRLLWSRDPLGFDTGVYQPAPSSAGTNAGKRWPYSSSFELKTAFFDHSSVQNRLTAAGAHNLFLTPSLAALFGARLSDAVFPAALVHLADTNARHFGMVQPYKTQDEARLPALLTDAAVRIVSARESNAGWLPNSGVSSSPTTYSYTPAAWEPPTVSGSPTDPVFGRFQWTRGFLDGRDFDGPETCTGQSGCP